MSSAETEVLCFSWHKIHVLGTYLLNGINVTLNYCSVTMKQIDDKNKKARKWNKAESKKKLNKIANTKSHKPKKYTRETEVQYRHTHTHIHTNIPVIMGGRAAHIIFTVHMNVKFEIRNSEYFNFCLIHLNLRSPVFHAIET